MSPCLIVAFENGVSMSPVDHITKFHVPSGGLKQNEISLKGTGCMMCKIQFLHFCYLRVGVIRGTSGEGLVK